MIRETRLSWIFKRAVRFCSQVGSTHRDQNAVGPRECKVLRVSPIITLWCASPTTGSGGGNTLMVIYCNRPWPIGWGSSFIKLELNICMLSNDKHLHMNSI